MVPQTEQDDDFCDFMQPSPQTEQKVVVRHPTSIAQRPPDIQVDIKFHEAFDSPGGDENSVVVVQEHAEAQVDGEEASGVKERQAADIEPSRHQCETSTCVRGQNYLLNGRFYCQTQSHESQIASQDKNLASKTSRQTI